jgi:hypothetical protein
MIKETYTNNQFDEVQENEIMAEMHELYSDIEWPKAYRMPSTYVDTRTGEMKSAKGFYTVIGSYKGEEHIWDVGQSQQYKPVSHERAVWRTIQMADELKQFGNFSVCKPVFYNDGAKLSIKGQFDTTMEVEGKSGRKHPLKPSLGGANSYDRSLDFSLFWRAVMQVCSNGLMAEKTMRLSGKHKQALDMEKIAQNVISGMAEYGDKINIWSTWEAKQLDGAQFAQVLEQLPYGPKQKEELLGMREIEVRGGHETGRSLMEVSMSGKVNLWDLTMFTSQYNTHHIDSIPVRTDKEAKSMKVIEKWANTIH